MTESSDKLRDIKFWLTKALSSENLTEISLSITGNSEIGDGYSSDMVFVHLDGKRKGQREQYDLALKCSKQSTAMRNANPAAVLFLNEIHFFSKIVPVYVQFEKQKNSDESLANCVAKYFGSFLEDTEVIVLQNLKKIGYDLWDGKKALTRSHVDLVVREYAKFHAISAAFQDQRKEDFDELVKEIHGNAFNQFMENTNGFKMLTVNIDEAVSSLEGQVDKNILTKFGELKNHTRYIFYDMFESRKFSVIIHGDCWNNNYMYYSETGDVTKPTKAALLDWQIIQLSSPIHDLSYFLFSNISKEDINDMDEILLNYYDIFSDYVNKLGSDPHTMYPRSVFLEEWKKFSKFGITMAPSVLKVVLSQPDEIVDLADILESGKDLSDAFGKGIKDKQGYNDRIKYIVEYAGRNDLL